jgi:hypothetical protein
MGFDITDCDSILHFEAFSFYTLWFWDTESVQGVVVDVDERVVAVVHGLNEVVELVHIGLVASVLACVVHHIV